MTNKKGIIQIIDTLEIGGAERVAVNLANHLPRSQYDSHLCSTRRDGILVEQLASDVQHLSLQRKNRFDVKAIRRLVEYITIHGIEILHAHGTSLFIAALSSIFLPFTKVVWHDHFGRFFVEERPDWIYRIANRRVSGIISVNQSLADWARIKLNVTDERVWYIPNYVCLEKTNGSFSTLPGRAGSRIVCVANLRPEKGHLYLLQAMKTVISEFPLAHLLIVGAAHDLIYLNRIEKEIEHHGLGEHVTLLGQQQDIAVILEMCDIGVMSSLSEGLPLVLLEYGAASLPVVCTEVGQCSEVLSDGKVGLLVPAADPLALAKAIKVLLESQSLRIELGKKFNSRVTKNFSMTSAIDQICNVYEQILSTG